MTTDAALSRAVLALVRGPYNPPVANHPNRSKANRNEAANPMPDEIRELREQSGLTQTEAARFVYTTLKTWQNWEAPIGSTENRRMHPAIWELWRLKTAHLRGE